MANDDIKSLLEKEIKTLLGNKTDEAINITTKKLASVTENYGGDDVKEDNNKEFDIVRDYIELNTKLKPMPKDLENQKRQIISAVLADLGKKNSDPFDPLTTLLYVYNEATCLPPGKISRLMNDLYEEHASVKAFEGTSEYVKFSQTIAKDMKDVLDSMKVGAEKKFNK